MTLIGHLLSVSDAYRAARGISASRLSSIVFGDGKVLPELARGERDITTRRLETGLLWFSTNWPEGADWPQGVERPTPTPSQPAEAAS